MKDLDEVYYIKIGKEKEYQIKKKFDKLKTKKSKISIDFVKGLLDDMIEHINNIAVFTEDNYAIAEIDVNNVLKDSEGYIDTSSKTTYIHFPIVEYDNDIKPRGDFQKIYSLLMDYSDTKNLLNDLKNYEDKRTCMNLGKIKKYLKIQEDSTFEGIKIQYNILYDKIMGHSDKLETFINDFEDSVLSNLILNIYYINKKYLNKNILIEKLNKYCDRNTINESEIEIDLEWASFLSKTREPFDKIILPMYSPESIIKLFFLKNGKGENDGGIFCISLLNKNLPDFYKQINKMLLEEKYTETLTLTIQTIFEIEMLRIYKDEENIKNVDDIQKIFNENFIEKIKKNEEVDILEVIKEIKENIQADSPHKSLLEFISDLFNYLLYLEDKDLERTKKSHDFEPGEETKDIINMFPDKKGIEEEGFSDEFSKSLIIPEFSIIKIVKE